jgi:hypothetical protein
MGCEKSGPVELIHPGEGQYPTLTYRYANGILFHLVRDWGEIKSLYHAVPPDTSLGGNFGGVIVGERGWVTTMSNHEITGGPHHLLQEMQAADVPITVPGGDHHGNWLHCIRTRTKPSSDEEIGHRAAALGHLTIIARKLGRSLKWDPERESFPDDEQANRLLTRGCRAGWHV